MGGGRVKIISDFDGVWTDQGSEVEVIMRTVADRAAQMLGVDPAQAWADVEGFATAVRADPARWGWAPDGRISAYVDEDPLCLSGSVAWYIEAGQGPDTGRYREAIHAAGFETVAAFADDCFVEATGTFRRDHPPALVEGAGQIVEQIHAAGIEMVVVSNSSAGKIVDWFRRAGIDAGEDEGHRVRIRGNAGKQFLGPTDRAIEVGGRKVHVDRPKYHAAILDEQPDLIIGDVFSLDLALPHVMRGEGHAAAPSQLVLRAHGHTPGWVLDTRAGGAIDAVVDSVGDVVGLVRGDTP